MNLQSSRYHGGLNCASVFYENVNEYYPKQRLSIDNFLIKKLFFTIDFSIRSVGRLTLDSHCLRHNEVNFTMNAVHIENIALLNCVSEEAVRHWIKMGWISWANKSEKTIDPNQEFLLLKAREREIKSAALERRKYPSPVVKNAVKEPGSEEVNGTKYILPEVKSPVCQTGVEDKNSHNDEFQPLAKAKAE